MMGGGVVDLVRESEDLALVSIAELTRLLSFPSIAAARAAIRKGLVPFPIIRIPRRRGLFAHRSDVNEYLRNLEVLDMQTKS